MRFGKMVKKCRTNRDLSLKDLSQLSGVSTSMLSQIEREEKIPTIRVAAQIAEALGTSLSSMLDEPPPARVCLVRRSERKQFIQSEQHLTRQLLSPFRAANPLEVSFCTLSAEATTSLLPPHRPGVKEILVVASGQARLLLDGEAYFLDTGDAICFAADVLHEMVNDTATPCEFYLIVYRGSGADAAPAPAKSPSASRG